MWLVAIVGALVCSVSGEVAPFLTPCRSGDTACLLASAKKAVPYLAAGVPALGLTSLDPMKVSMVSTDQAGLHLEMRDTVVKGLRNCEILSMRRNGRRMGMDLKCSVILNGDYALSGKLLILPIEGTGKYKIKIRDIVVKIQYELADTQRGGETYWRVANWQQSTDVLTNVQYQFQNLFNGNKQASDTIHQFANENWKEIYHEVAPPVVKAIIANIIKEIEKLFAKVPVREMSLD